MIAPEHCQLMARYTRWMNERLYAVLADMTDAERKEDRGAFFGSMHRTLNHLLWGDRMWLGRFTGELCTVPAFGTDVYDDFSALRREREITDRNLVDWAGGVTAAWLASTLRYRASGDGKQRDIPAAVAVVHLFNHGTHHRGQLTTLISQSGRDPGVTDLVYMPGIARLVDA